MEIGICTSCPDDSIPREEHFEQLIAGRRTMFSRDASSTTETLDGEHVFDFFALSRELRNMIYSELTHDVYLAPTEAHDELKQIVYLRNAALPPLLSICRQFATEYEEEVLRSTSCQFVTFAPSDGSSFRPLIRACRALTSRKTVFARIHTFALNLVGFTKDELLNGMQTAVRPLLEFLPSIRSFDICNCCQLHPSNEDGATGLGDLTAQSRQWFDEDFNRRA
ncbi:hypothetical protein LTR86_004762 [Recurvomyces mirabilis]|nr:hypothetical protein LTR86_004762 [Recurvomyces mirabilis]